MLSEEYSSVYLQWTKNSLKFFFVSSGVFRYHEVIHIRSDEDYASIFSFRTSFVETFSLNPESWLHKSSIHVKSNFECGMQSRPYPYSYHSLLYIEWWINAILLLAWNLKVALSFETFTFVFVSLECSLDEREPQPLFGGVADFKMEQESLLVVS